MLALLSPVTCDVECGVAGGFAQAVAGDAGVDALIGMAPSPGYNAQEEEVAVGKHDCR